MRGSFGALVAALGVALLIAVGAPGAAASDPDVTPPVLTLPADMTMPVDQWSIPPTLTVWSYNVSAWDDTDGSVPVTCAPLPALIVPLGTTATVTCSATDAAGNTATGSFTVTAVAPETNPPVLTLPGDITENASPWYDPPGAYVYWSAYATDDTDGWVPAVCQPENGSFFAAGTTTVACSASDRYGNTATGSFTVTVVPDTTPPVLTLPGDITVNATPWFDPPGVYVSYLASAWDESDGSVPVVCQPADGSIFRIGTTAVECSASDRFGNTATGSFTVTVVVPETNPPVFSGVTDIDRVAPDASGASVDYSVYASDVDTPYPQPTIVCTPPSGSFFELGTTHVTCTASDVWGNAATAEFDVHVLAPLEWSFVLNSEGAVDPTTGVVTLSGTLTCSRAITAALILSVEQRHGRSIFRSAVYPSGLSCAPGGVLWSAVVPAGTGLFSPGTATVSAEADVVDVDWSGAWTYVTQDVRLKASNRK